jgi:hypothetical protein
VNHLSLGKTLFGFAFAALLCGCASTAFRVRQADPPPAVADTVHYASFRQAVEQADTAYALAHANNGPETDLAQALRAMLKGENEQAIPFARKAWNAAADSVTYCTAREFLQILYMAGGRWHDLQQLYAQDTLYRDPDADDRPLVEAFAAAAPERYEFPPLPQAVPITLNAPGLPVVEVMVNGHPRRFIVDTGAAFTVLASDFAAECGVLPIPGKDILAGTSTTRKVGIQPAIIDSFRIGKLQIRNHPAVILQASDLRFRLFGLLTVFKIDGIVGWNALRNLHVTIDYAHEELRIREPEPLAGQAPTLLNLDQPLLLLRNQDGIPCCFFLDTGSNATSLTEKYLTKTQAKNLQSASTLIGGAGGMQRYKSFVVPEATFYTHGTSIAFKNLRTHPEMGERLIARDGVLGSDILQHGSILLDCANSRCEFYIH